MMKRQNGRSLVLVLGMMLYILAGAAIFERLEAGNEETGMKQLQVEKTFLQDRFNLTEDAWAQISDHLVRFMPHRTGFQWRYAGAVYFSTTVITTIGYGHSTPKTNWGKVFCMLYALVGIPLNLVMFQSIGERLNTFNTFLLCGIRRKLSKNRKISVSNDAQNQNIDENNQLKQRCWLNKQTEGQESERDNHTNKYYVQIRETPTQTDEFNSSKRKVYINLNKEINSKHFFDEIISIENDNSKNHIFENLQKKDVKLELQHRNNLQRASLNELLSSSFATSKFHLSDTHLICVTTAISSIFVAGGAYAFSRFEGWTYLDSFYYCVITLTTVGFGDLVALQNDKELQNKPAYVALNVLFILTGLAVVSAAMNLLVLRFLTMNTVDEKRDMMKETIMKSNISSVSNESLSNSQNVFCQKKHSCQSSLSAEEDSSLWEAVQKFHLIGKYYVCEPPLACPSSTLKYSLPVGHFQQQQQCILMQNPRYDHHHRDKYPTSLEIPFPLNLYHSRSRLLTL